MRKKTIAIIDSGLGGLHILNECQKILPSYKFVYVADFFNAPYGNKSKKALYKIACGLIENINRQYRPQAIVFACNTLTVNTINQIRKKYNLKFVGVEPALKQAKIFGGDMIIFATKSTLKFYNNLNKKVDKQLKKEYKKQKLIYKSKDKTHKVFVPNLPQEIDKNWDNLDCLTEKLKAVFGKDIYKKCDNIVLGCTHFLAIKPQLKNILGSNISFFDGSKAVAKQVFKIVEAKKSSKKFDLQNNLKIISTDGDVSKKQNLLNYFKKIYTADKFFDNS
ncbi:MAG: aspartate/glutamate racemase family protein [Clostridia bacterium]|nr:aspartate/glutamate racemase family protein [Clostridia bacterium]